MIYKIHDNIKRVEGGKRIPQWTFYFFEKAILNGCRVRAYFILLPGILYYLSIEKLENLKFRHSKVWIKYLDWTFFRCDKNISSSETRRRISSNFVHHLKLNRLISRYRVRIIYIRLAEYIYIHTRAIIRGLRSTLFAKSVTGARCYLWEREERKSSSRDWKVHRPRRG